MAQPLDWERRVDNFVKALEGRLMVPAGALEVRYAPTAEHLTAERAGKLAFKPIRGGQSWGKEWEYGWFRCEVKASRALPARRGEPAGRGGRGGRAGRAGKDKAIVLTGNLGDDGNESIVFVNGRAVGGLDPWHRTIDLTALAGTSARAGRRLEILLESYAGHRRPGVYFEFLYPGSKLLPDEKSAYQTFRGLRLAEWNEEAFQLWMDAVTLRRLVKAIAPDSLRAHKLEAALRELSCTLDLEAAQEDFDAAIPAARKLLAPLLAARNGSTMPQMYCFGHAHIDVAWLWPLAQTYRKSAHTFSSMLALMDRYQEYKFLQSQAQLYDYLRVQYPEIYARIKRAARRGQWIADGAMWVEADMNVSGGEALIRQFLLGKRFFKDEFGVECDLCWLPDVFGYNANLPQILRGCGVKYFSTQKIFWNYHGGTTHPYETFWWEGIDGSTVLTHLHRDYNAETHPEWLAKRWQLCVSKDVCDKFLLPFGWGDGGGGPTRMHLEYLRREQDLEGVPRTKMATPAEFFKDLEKSIDTKTLPRWVGELYLEVHRGTYTSQARTKRGNRKCEQALREAELWSALAAALDGRKYPAARLEASWKKVLLNQFHDILPGSSIGRVYAEAEALHREVLDDAVDMSDAARRSLVGAGGGYTVFNSLSWRRDALVNLPDEGCPVDSTGRPLPAQAVGTGKNRRLLVAVADIPSCGAKAVRFVGWANGPRGQRGPASGVGLLAHPTMGVGQLAHPTERVSAEAAGDGAVMENGQLRLRLNGRGEIVELLDKSSGRQLVPGGTAMSCLELYRDNPANWDAWDIDISYKCGPVKLGPAESVKVVASGPLEARVAVRRRVGRSTVDQQIILGLSSRRVDFDTNVDWQETHRLLKVAFPADLTAPVLRGEIQFGHVIRPTHRNTEFERQRFEWPAQKWADLSEAFYGIAVLNDCKYGYDILGGVLRLTLLRAPIAPDPTADRGLHEFVYALYVHDSGFAESGVVRAAYDLNVPVTVATGAVKHEGDLVAISHPAVVCETVKAGEDGAGLVLRLYEAAGSSARAVVRVAGAYRSAWLTNMLEEPARRLALAGGAFELSFRPFEVKTVKLV